MRHAAFFALRREGEAQVARRGIQDAERNPAKQAEAVRLEKELEQLEKAKVTHELRAAPAAKLNEHRRPQQAERVEYHVCELAKNLDKHGPLTKNCVRS